MTPRKLREKTEERLRQVTDGGRLAHWLGTATAEQACRPVAQPAQECRRAADAAARAATILLGRLDQPCEPSPTTTSTPGPEVVLALDHGRPSARTGWRPAARRGSLGPRPRPRTTRTLSRLGRVAAVALDEARCGRAAPWSGPARPCPGAGVVDADRDLVREDLVALRARRWRRRSGTSTLPGNGAVSAEIAQAAATSEQHAQRRQRQRRARHPAASARHHVHAGVQDVALLEGGAQGAVQAVLEVVARRATRRRGRTGRRRTWSPRRAARPAGGCPWWSPAGRGGPAAAAPPPTRARTARGRGRADLPRA